MVVNYCKNLDEDLVQINNLYTLLLKEVSKNRQVLCVTHQAQIAALADYHYLIQKQVEQGRTFTSVGLLDHDGRKNELARIIGGVNITEAALSHAESMLLQYDN